MNLKNITLKVAELGPVNWEDVEKLQPGEAGFICFVSYTTEARQTEDGDSYNILIGTYISTPFDYKPTYKEVINYIIQQEYPNGKESQMLRLGVRNPEDKEYLLYYEDVEDITSTIKNLLYHEQTEA